MWLDNYKLMEDFVSKNHINTLQSPQILRIARHSANQSVYSIPISFDPPPNYEEVIKDVHHKYFIDVVSEIPEVHGKNRNSSKVNLRSYSESSRISLSLANEDSLPTYSEALKREQQLRSYNP